MLIFDEGAPPGEVYRLILEEAEARGVSSVDCCWQGVQHFEVTNDGKQISLVEVSDSCYVQHASRCLAGSEQAEFPLTESCHRSLPDAWRLFSYLLPRRVRERVFEPAYNELLEDYLTTRGYRSKWAQRWIALCFTFRTVVMVLNCLQSSVADQVRQFVAQLVPDLVKKWWLSQ